MSKNIDDALDFAGHDAKTKILDSLFCMFHNEGYTLAGNTEESDPEWFARQLYEFDSRGSWDHAEEVNKEHYRTISNFVISILPQLTQRIANRYIAMSRALETTLKLERDRKYAIYYNLMDQSKK